MDFRIHRTILKNLNTTINLFELNIQTFAVIWVFRVCPMLNHTQSSSSNYVMNYRQIPSQRQLNSGTVATSVSDRHRINSETRRHHQTSVSTTPYAPPSSSHRSEKFVGSPKLTNLVSSDVEHRFVFKSVDRNVE